jgi:formylmethanofuran dehydrogenase subunit E
VAELNDLLHGCARLHHHLCPRQVLGVRMGMLAGRLHGLELPQDDKRMFVFMETDGCGADGVSVATGCWVGRRTMRMIDHGKLAATFVDTKTGRALRIHPHPLARERALVLLPQAQSRWHAQRDGYQHLSDADLLVAEPVELSVDLDEILGRPGSRLACQVCGEEIFNQREVAVEGSTLCRACAGDSYFASSQVPVFVTDELRPMAVV